ncbi:MAG: aldehyde dehydrogenase [Gemmatimonadetes bacterium]|nr:aldehyde dehydrogenase [Gemmatimonadota bacterium]
MTWSRREFLVAGAAAGGGLLISCRLGRRDTGLAAGTFAPNAWIRVGRDGAVTLVMSQVEMGQGTYTSMPMLLAEELEVGLDQVTLEAAPPDNALYSNPALGFQATGGSTSVRTMWVPLRQAGATARAMLVAAAAKEWGVDPASCRAGHGVVYHDASRRQLAYGELADKAATLPVPKKVALKDPKDWKLIGTSAKRLDSPAKVNGTAKFGIDTVLPGMRIATVAACPVFGGTLAGVDESKAMAVKGVSKVVRLDNAVAVVGEHMWAAKQGLAALDIKWNDGPHAALTTADVVKQLETASAGPGTVARKDGDVAAAMASATTKLEAIYEAPFLAHATMEPANCTVHVRADGCDVWVGTQVATRAQQTAAKVTGLSTDKVKVHNHLIGGGFGRRLEVDYFTQAVEIAKQVDGPVKVIWSREEDIQHDMYRPYYYDRIAAGLDAGGKPVAWSHRIAGASIINRWAEKSLRAARAVGLQALITTIKGIDLDAVDGAIHPPYDFPSMLVEYVRVEPPGIPTAFWRGVGATHNVFVVESFIDELAAAARQDPVAYRQALLGKSPRARAVLELAAARAGWGEPLPAGRGRGISVQNVFGSYVAQVAEVEVSGSDVRVTRVVAAVDCGTQVNPDGIVAQMQSGIIFGASAALYGEITLKNGRVQQSNFGDYRVLRINESPAIEVHLVRNTEAPGGMGEPGTAAVMPAIANAVFAATGKRVRKLPISTALAG